MCFVLLFPPFFWYFWRRVKDSSLYMGFSQRSFQIIVRGGVGEGRQDARKELWGVCPKGNPAMEGNRRQRQRVFDEHLRRSNLLGGDIYSLLSRWSLHPCHRLLCCRWGNSSLSASKRNLKQNSTDCPVFILILVRLPSFHLNTCPLSGAKIFMDIEFEREMGERDAKMAKTDVSSDLSGLLS